MRGLEYWTFGLYQNTDGLSTPAHFSVETREPGLPFISNFEALDKDRFKAAAKSIRTTSVED